MGCGASAAGKLSDSHQALLAAMRIGQLHERYCPDTNAVKALIETEGFDLNVVHPEFSYAYETHGTLLHKAIDDIRLSMPFGTEERIEIVKMIIAAGPDINKVTGGSVPISPLHLVCRSFLYTCVKLSPGGDAYEINPSREAWEDARKKSIPGYIEIAQLLIKAGADVCTKAYIGTSSVGYRKGNKAETPLEWLTSQCVKETTKMGELAMFDERMKFLDIVNPDVAGLS